MAVTRCRGSEVLVGVRRLHGVGDVARCFLDLQRGLTEADDDDDVVDGVADDDDVDDDDELLQR